jgi:Holliday junction DNA helicase RuvB
MNEILTGNLLEEEGDEKQLRPQYLDDFVGQAQSKDNLKVFIAAAKNRQEALDHVLLYGPPGLGKTTISQIVAREMGVNFKATSGPMLTKAGDLAAILTNLEKNDVLFIDEIHRLQPSIEEVLYPAMEDFNLDLIIGEGPAARTIRIDLPKFTLIGATTRLGLLTNPLRDRFGIPLRLQFYSPEELCLVLERGAAILQLKITRDGAMEIAHRSRGTPRIALRLLKRVGDFAAIEKEGVLNSATADYALKKLEIDAHGLDSNDIRYLKFIAENYAGGPVGVETISAALSEQKDSIEETIEPYLIQQGFVQRTPRGRILTGKSFLHLGLEQPKPLQAELKFIDQESED